MCNAVMQTIAGLGEDTIQLTQVFRQIPVSRPDHNCPLIGKTTASMIFSRNGRAAQIS